MRGKDMLTMLHCHWAGKRLDRYLDRDPSAVLSDVDLKRMEEHLATCPRCARIAARQRVLSAALASSVAGPPPAALVRAHERLAAIADDGTT